jgi:hypothetical protein
MPTLYTNELILSFGCGAAALGLRGEFSLCVLWLRLRRAGLFGELFHRKSLSLPENIFRKFTEAHRKLFSEFSPVVFLSLFIKSKTLFRTDTSVSQCALLIRGIALALSTKKRVHG